MAKKKTSELAAGIFVVAAIVAGLGVVIWLGGAELLTSVNRFAFFVPQDSGSMGVAVGSFVRVNDAEVGEITEIRYEADHARTLYIGEVDRYVKLYSDGVARVESAFIGAASVVILSAGSSDNPPADEDNPIVLTSGGLTAGLNALASELDANRPEALLAKLHVIINKIKAAAGDVAEIADNLSSETDKAELASAIAKVHKSLDDINAMTADATPKVKKTLTALEETVEKIRGYSKEELGEIFANVRVATKDIGKIAADFAVVAGGAKEIMLVNRDRIDEIIDNMTVMTANLKSAAKEIRRNPWRLLYEPKPGELASQNIYDAARSFASGAEQLDQALSKLTGLAKAHPEALSADDPQLRQIREHLDETFKQFRKAEDALWKELVK